MVGREARVQKTQDFVLALIVIVISFCISFLICKVRVLAEITSKYHFISINSEFTKFLSKKKKKKILLPKFLLLSPNKNSFMAVVILLYSWAHEYYKMIKTT